MSEESTAPYKKIPIDNSGRINRQQVRIKSPSSLIIISFPKMGKTVSMINVKGILIGDTHFEVDDYPHCYNYAKLWDYGPPKFYMTSNGAYIPSGIFETVRDLDRANRMTEYKNLKSKLDDNIPFSDKLKVYEDLKAHLNSMPFPIFAVETVTHLQELNLRAALKDYNSQVAADKQRTDIRKVDKYGGAKYIRNNFAGIKSFIENNAAPFLIWTSHIKERKKIYEKSYEDVGAVDMALEGIMSTTFTAAASAVGILYRKNDGVYLDFKKRDETDLGSRCTHLAEKIIRIAEPQIDSETPPVTHWGEIYPELSF